MRTLSEFATTLNEAKKARKLTANALAERTGLTAQAVRQILSGESAPRLTNAMALAAELGLELVLLPKDAAQSLAAPPQTQRTVVSDVERLVQGSSVFARAVRAASTASAAPATTAQMKTR